MPVAADCSNSLAHWLMYTLNRVGLKLHPVSHQALSHFKALSHTGLCLTPGSVSPPGSVSLHGSVSHPGSVLHPGSVSLPGPVSDLALSNTRALSHNPALSHTPARYQTPTLSHTRPAERSLCVSIFPAELLFVFMDFIMLLVFLQQHFQSILFTTADVFKVNKAGEHVRDDHREAGQQTV